QSCTCPPGPLGLDRTHLWTGVNRAYNFPSMGACGSSLFACSPPRSHLSVLQRGFLTTGSSRRDLRSARTRDSSDRAVARSCGISTNRQMLPAWRWHSYGKALRTSAGWEFAKRRCERRSLLGVNVKGRSIALQKGQEIEFGDGDAVLL